MIEITTNSEIKQAIFEKKPIVALESTIISHGLPFPENYNTAIALEEEVRRQGSIPATIAIIAGKIKVGLEPEDLDILSDPKSLVEKVSRRDIPSVLQNRGNGATTVAATMIINGSNNFPVFINLYLFLILVMVNMEQHLIPILYQY